LATLFRLLLQPNVLISDEGDVQVTDFGVSIMDHREIEFSVTSTGAGTQRWQAPEILRGDSDSSKEADVYALGMVRSSFVFASIALTQLFRP
jgi:serine/threonine protein kinase